MITLMMTKLKMTIKWKRNQKIFSVKLTVNWNQRVFTHRVMTYPLNTRTTRYFLFFFSKFRVLSFYLNHCPKLTKIIAKRHGKLQRGFRVISAAFLCGKVGSPPCWFFSQLKIDNFRLNQTLKIIIKITLKNYMANLRQDV